MRTSDYTFIFEEKNIVYNALNGGLVKLNEQVFDIFKNDQISEKNIQQNSEILEELKNNYFLVEENFNEVDYVKHSHNTVKYRDSTLGLTIAPTLNCNFSCVYCIQEDNMNDYNSCNNMSYEIADEIISFIKNKNNSTKLNKLHITWYGGEPLISFDIIKYLSEKITTFCENENIEYISSMITNGYLLKEKKAKFLSENEVKMLQITIDGPPEIHNQRRRHKETGDNFETIIKNIKNNANLFKNIVIRINVDKSNKDFLTDIFNRLEYSFEEYNNVSYYISPTVDDVRKECSLPIYTKKEFANLKHKLANEKKMPSIISYPKMKYGTCTAVKKNAFVIGPEGRLYKCWNEIGAEKKKVGKLEKGQADISNMGRFLKWINYDPTEITSCSGCKHLPICMGNCPYRVLFEEESNSPQECNEFKHHLKNFILKWLNEKDKIS